MSAAAVSSTTGYINYVYNVEAKGVSQLSSEIMGASGAINNMLGQLAFQTSAYLSRTESAAMSMGIVATAGLYKATQQAIKFDYAMQGVQAIAGKNNIGNLGDQAMEMSNKFGVAIDKMVKGLESLARAGVSPQNMSGILEQAMGLSKLEDLDLNTAINDLLSTTNLLDTKNLDLESPEYVEALKYQNQKITATSEAAPINAQDIIHTLEHVGGYASSTNIDQDDLYAVIAQLGSKGTRSELAGTSLRAFLAAGQKDTAQRALKRIGLNVSDLWKNDDTIMSISDMKDVLDEAMDERGYSKQERLEFYSDFVGYKQANQVMKIDTASVRDYKNKIDQSLDINEKINMVLNTTQTRLQNIFQTGRNFLTKVGQPIMFALDQVLKPINFVVGILDKIPGLGMALGITTIFVAIKGIATIFNKLAPMVLNVTNNFKGIKGYIADSNKEFEKMIDLLRNIGNKEYVAKTIIENETQNVGMNDIRKVLESREFFSRLDADDKNRYAQMFESNMSAKDKKVLQAFNIARLEGRAEDMTQFSSYNFDAFQLVNKGLFSLSESLGIISDDMVKSNNNFKKSMRDLTNTFTVYKMSDKSNVRGNIHNDMIGLNVDAIKASALATNGSAYEYGMADFLHEVVHNLLEHDNIDIPREQKEAEAISLVYRIMDAMGVRYDEGWRRQQELAFNTARIPEKRTKEMDKLYDAFMNQDTGLQKSFIQFYNKNVEKLGLDSKVPTRFAAYGGINEEEDYLKNAFKWNPESIRNAGNKSIDEFLSEARSIPELFVRMVKQMERLTYAFQGEDGEGNRSIFTKISSQLGDVNQNLTNVLKKLDEFKEITVEHEVVLTDKIEINDKDKELLKNLKVDFNFSSIEDGIKDTFKKFNVDSKIKEFLDRLQEELKKVPIAIDIEKLSNNVNDFLVETFKVDVDTDQITSAVTEGVKQNITVTVDPTSLNKILTEEVLENNITLQTGNLDAIINKLINKIGTIALKVDDMGFIQKVVKILSDQGINFNSSGIESSLKDVNDILKSHNDRFNDIIDILKNKVVNVNVVNNGGFVYDNNSSGGSPDDSPRKFPEKIYKIPVQGFGKDVRNRVNNQRDEVYRQTNARHRQHKRDKFDEIREEEERNRRYRQSSRRSRQYRRDRANRINRESSRRKSSDNRNYFTKEEDGLYIPELEGGKYFVVDIEATSKNTKTAIPFQIGGQLISGGRVTGNYDTLIDQKGIQIPQEVEKLTGIKTKDLKGQADPKKVAEDLVNLIKQGYTFVAHNAHYDMNVITRFIRKYANENDKDLIPNIVDSLTIAKSVVPKLQKGGGHSLNALAELFNIENENAHTALSDAKTTVKVLKELLKESVNISEYVNIIGFYGDSSPYMQIPGVDYRQQNPTSKPRRTPPKRKKGIRDPIIKKERTNTFSHNEEVETGLKFSNDIDLSTSVFEIFKELVEQGVDISSYIDYRLGKIPRPIVDLSALNAYGFSRQKGNYLDPFGALKNDELFFIMSESLKGSQGLSFDVPDTSDYGANEIYNRTLSLLDNLLEDIRSGAARATQIDLDVPMEGLNHELSNREEGLASFLKVWGPLASNIINRKKANQYSGMKAYQRWKIYRDKLEAGEELLDFEQDDYYSLDDKDIEEFLDFKSFSGFLKGKQEIRNLYRSKVSNGMRFITSKVYGIDEYTNDGDKERRKTDEEFQKELNEAIEQDLSKNDSQKFNKSLDYINEIYESSEYKFLQEMQEKLVSSGQFATESSAKGFITNALRYSKTGVNIKDSDSLFTIAAKMHDLEHKSDIEWALNKELAEPSGIDIEKYTHTNAPSNMSTRNASLLEKFKDFILGNKKSRDYFSDNVFKTFENPYDTVYALDSPNREGNRFIVSSTAPFNGKAIDTLDNLMIDSENSFASALRIKVTEIQQTRYKMMMKAMADSFMDLLGIDTSVRNLSTFAINDIVKFIPDLYTTQLLGNRQTTRTLITDDKIPDSMKTLLNVVLGNLYNTEISAKNYQSLEDLSEVRDEDIEKWINSSIGEKKINSEGAYRQPNKITNILNKDIAAFVLSTLSNSMLKYAREQNNWTENPLVPIGPNVFERHYKNRPVSTHLRDGVLVTSSNGEEFVIEDTADLYDKNGERDSDKIKARLMQDYEELSGGIDIAQVEDIQYYTQNELNSQTQPEIYTIPHDLSRTVNNEMLSAFQALLKVAMELDNYAESFLKTFHRKKKGIDLDTFNPEDIKNIQGGPLLEFLNTLRYNQQSFSGIDNIKESLIQMGSTEETLEHDLAIFVDRLFDAMTNANILVKDKGLISNRLTTTIHAGSQEELEQNFESMKRQGLTFGELMDVHVSGKKVTAEIWNLTKLFENMEEINFVNIVHNLTELTNSISLLNKSVDTERFDNISVDDLDEGMDLDALRYTHIDFSQILINTIENLFDSQKFKEALIKEMSPGMKQDDIDFNLLQSLAMINNDVYNYLLESLDNLLIVEDDIANIADFDENFKETFPNLFINPQQIGKSFLARLLFPTAMNREIVPELSNFSLTEILETQKVNDINNLITKKIIRDKINIGTRGSSVILDNLLTSKEDINNSIITGLQPTEEGVGSEDYSFQQKTSKEVFIPTRESLDSEAKIENSFLGNAQVFRSDDNRLSGLSNTMSDNKISYRNISLFDPQLINTGDNNLDKFQKNIAIFSEIENISALLGNMMVYKDSRYTENFKKQIQQYLLSLSEMLYQDIPQELLSNEYGEMLNLMSLMSKDAAKAIESKKATRESFIRDLNDDDFENYLYNFILASKLFNKESNNIANFDGNSLDDSISKVQKKNKEHAEEIKGRETEEEKSNMKNNLREDDPLKNMLKTKYGPRVDATLKKMYETYKAGGKIHYKEEKKKDRTFTGYISKHDLSVPWELFEPEIGEYEPPTEEDKSFKEYYNPASAYSAEAENPNLKWKEDDNRFNKIPEGVAKNQEKKRKDMIKESLQSMLLIGKDYNISQANELLPDDVDFYSLIEDKDSYLFKFFYSYGTQFQSTFRDFIEAQKVKMDESSKKDENKANAFDFITKGNMNKVYKGIKKGNIKDEDNAILNDLSGFAKRRGYKDFVIDMLMDYGFEYKKLRNRTNRNEEEETKYQNLKNIFENENFNLKEEFLKDRQSEYNKKLDQNIAIALKYMFSKIKFDEEAGTVSSDTSFSSLPLVTNMKTQLKNKGLLSSDINPNKKGLKVEGIYDGIKEDENASYKKAQDQINNLRSTLSEKSLAMSSSIFSFANKFTNEDKVAQSASMLTDFDKGLDSTLHTLRSWGAALDDFAGMIPGVSLALLGFEQVINAIATVQKANNFVNDIINRGLNANTDTVTGKIQAAIGQVLGTVLGTISEILMPYIVPLVAIASALTVSFFAVKGALDWSFQSHQKYMKTLEEEQKEHKSSSRSLQATVNQTRKLAEKNTNPIKQAQRERKYELARVRLQNANMSRASTAIDMTRAKNDVLWGDYGISAGLSKLGGNYESTAEQYEGTSQQTRLIKEATLANPFSTGSMTQVARYYDANQLAFGQMDEYKSELGALYDEESRLVKKYDSVEEARKDPKFEEALDRFVEATGITRDHAQQYLDYMQTEHNVNQAKIAMQAESDRISSETEMKIQAIQFGGNPADVLGLNGIEAQQSAMVKAQADMIKIELSGQLWWKAVWSTIVAPVKLIMSPLFMIVDILGAIWSLITGNFDNAFALGGKAISRMNVLAEPATYWSAWGQVESTDFASIGESNIDETSRANYGNGPTGQGNVGRNHGTNLINNKKGGGLFGLFGGKQGGGKGGSAFKDHKDIVKDNAKNSFLGGLFGQVLSALSGIAGTLTTIAILIGGGFIAKELIGGLIGGLGNGRGININTESIKNALSGLGGLGGKIGNIFKKVPGLDKIGKIFENIPGFEIGKKLFGNIKLPKSLDNLKDIFGKNLGNIKYKGFGASIKGLFSDLKKGAKYDIDKFKSEHPAIGGVMDNYTNYGRNKIKGLKQSIKGGIGVGGKWSDYIQGKMSDHGITGENIKGKTKQYGSVWAEYAKNQIKDKIKPYDGKITDFKEKIGIGGDSSIIEMLKDPQKIEDWAKGRIKNKINSYDDNSVVGRYRKRVGTAKRVLSDPEEMEKYIKGKAGQFKARGEEELAWADNGGLEASDMSLAGKVAKFKRDKLGIGENESLDSILSNPERAVEIGKKGYSAIKEHGFANTAADIVGSTTDGTGVLGEVKSTFGIDLEEDLKEALNVDKDLSVKDALKDKISDIFSKENIEEAVEEGVDEEDSGESFISKAKQKLTGLFNGGEKEEPSEEDVEDDTKEIPSIYSSTIDNKNLKNNLKYQSQAVKAQLSIPGVDSDDVYDGLDGTRTQQDIHNEMANNIKKQMGEELDAKDKSKKDKVREEAEQYSIYDAMRDSGKEPTPTISGENEKSRYKNASQAVKAQMPWLYDGEDIYGDLETDTINKTENQKILENARRQQGSHLRYKSQAVMGQVDPYSHHSSPRTEEEIEQSKIKNRAYKYGGHANLQNMSGEEIAQREKEQRKYFKKDEIPTYEDVWGLGDNGPKTREERQADIDKDQESVRADIAEKKKNLALPNKSSNSLSAKGEEMQQQAAQKQALGTLGQMMDNPVSTVLDTQSALGEGTIYCPECGYANDPDSTYCEQCGARLDGKGKIGGMFADKTKGIRSKLSGVKDKGATLKSKMNKGTVGAAMSKIGESSVGQAIFGNKFEDKAGFAGTINNAKDSIDKVRNGDVDLEDVLTNILDNKTVDLGKVFTNVLEGEDPDLKSIFKDILGKEGLDIGKMLGGEDGNIIGNLFDTGKKALGLEDVDTSKAENVVSDLASGKDPKDIAKDTIKDSIDSRGGGVKGVKNLFNDAKGMLGGEGGSDIMDTAKDMFSGGKGKGGKMGKTLNKVSKAVGGKGGKALGKAGKLMGKAGGALGKVGGKVAGKIGGKLAGKAAAQIGSKVLGGALMATGVGAPLGLLLESPIGGMLMEGAMNLGGKALGAVGGAIGGAGKAIGGFLSNPLGAIGGLFGGGKGVQSGTGRGSRNQGIMGGMGALGLLGGLGAVGMIGGGLMGAIGGLFGGSKGEQKNMAKAQLQVPNLLDKIFNKNKESHGKQGQTGDLVGKILKALLKDKDSNKGGSSGGVNIIIHNININTDDDPEKIKTAFMNLMVELKDQVSPRIVSRTVGEKPEISTGTDTNTTNTTDPNDSSTSDSQNNNNSNSNSSNSNNNSSN